MIGLLQRVTGANVAVGGEVVGAIGPGMLVLACAEPADTTATAEKLLRRLLAYRVFYDDNGKMNLNVAQVNGGLLIVPQFTLAADTRSGTRPSFTPAAAPTLARQLFDYVVERARAVHPMVATGQFGADMKVSLINDGPVTFWLQVSPTHEGS